MNNSDDNIKPQFLVPDWPAPAKVKALSTTRLGGYSHGSYQGLNLGDHVGDDPETVVANRRLLRSAANLPAEPTWLRQVHQARVVDVGHPPFNNQADGSVTNVPAVVCVVLTADCLPVLLCNRLGDRVAALHAGWRGLAGGVLEAGVNAMAGSPADLMAWIGPAIGPFAFEVGDELREAFVTAEQAAEQAFVARDGRWLADLPMLARQRLVAAGVAQVYGGQWCTYQDQQRFFSYRRDGNTGRQASLLWIDP